MHAQRLVYATFGHWVLQAALPVSNIHTLNVNSLSIAHTNNTLNCFGIAFIVWELGTFKLLVIWLTVFG